MTVLEYIYIVGAACTILFLILAVSFLTMFFANSKKLKSLPAKRFKNKKKQQKLNRIREKLAIAKKKKIKLFALFLCLGIGIGAGSAYASYYLSMNLTKNDSEAIVKAYYLLGDFEAELESAKNQNGDEVKIQKNLRYLATVMASFGTTNASYLNTEEGQLTLNRYYNAIKQLGVNASVQSNNFYGNAELVDEYLKDSQKVRDFEKSAFTYYKVSEDALLKADQKADQAAAE